MTNDAQTVQQEGWNGSLGSEAQGHGGELKKGPLRLTEQEAKRFWAKVCKGGPTKSDELGACWSWIGGCSGDGYGAFGFRRKQLGAHRVSFSIHYHVPPAGFVVMHACDNPNCVNPKHLSQGTAKENTNDSLKKGRWPSGEKHFSRTNPELLARGERNGYSKFTAQDVIEIRRLSKNGMNNGEIARLYSVYKSTVRNVVIGKTWNHIR